MRLQYHPISLGAFGCLTIMSIASAQGPPPAPLDLTIAFAGQSAADPTKPNVPVTFTDVVGSNLKVLQPRSDGFLPR